MARIEEADKRLFGRKFICRRCKSAIRAPNMAVSLRKVACRRCKGKALRPVRKK